ncbi:M67 family metallopeptidase, partial [Xanthovirga aplysinae]|uniref:M67 family metallopeptidase n=1 Tax=Xanthovirga aplysinae TaxID=2529853 RepID=UPI0012BD12A8
PNECCGFLFGKDGSIRVIEEAIPVKNVKEGDQRRRFQIDALDYMKAEKYALQNGIQFLGIYHSHPDHPAEPSIHDLKQAVPFFSYIIASVYKRKLKEVTSWRLNEDHMFYKEGIL